jgi:hypothetical protein
VFADRMDGYGASVEKARCALVFRTCPVPEQHPGKADFVVAEVGDLPVEHAGDAEFFVAEAFGRWQIRPVQRG